MERRVELLVKKNTSFDIRGVGPGENQEHNERLDSVKRMVNARRMFLEEERVVVHDRMNG